MTDLSPADLQTVTNVFFENGVPIEEINAVRTDLSTIKGEQLAGITAPMTVVGLISSDVVGNDLSVIASEPLSPDEITFRDTLDVVDRYEITVPHSVTNHFDSDGKIPEIPTTDSSVFNAVKNHTLADNFTTFETATKVVSNEGYDPLLLPSRIPGEAKEAVKTHIGITEEIQTTANPIGPPAVVISGGETTLTENDDEAQSGICAQFRNKDR